MLPAEKKARKKADQGEEQGEFRGGEWCRVVVEKGRSAKGC